MTQQERYERAQRDRDWPCQIVAVFRWRGTANEYFDSFNSEAAFREFQAKNAGRLELWDCFYHKARYIREIDSPKVIDYNDGYHTQAQIQEAASILGYCTAKPYDAPLSSLSRRERYARSEREAYQRWIENQKTNTITH